MLTGNPVAGGGGVDRSTVSCGQKCLPEYVQVVSATSANYKNCPASMVMLFKWSFGKLHIQ